MAETYRASEVAKIYGVDHHVILNACHARGQTFATRLKPKGRFYINLDKFREWWDRQQDKTREARGY